MDPRRDRAERGGARRARRAGASLQRRLALRLAGALATLALSAAGEARIVVVGVDGLGWRFVDPMLAAGEMPNLARLIARGASAELETVEPAISPVVWTSLATGRRPEAHGVTSFLASRLSVRVPTVFERLAADGRRVGLYDYLVTWPPPALPGGFVAPGWMRRGPELWPKDLWTRAGVAPYRVDYDSVPDREAHVAGIRGELARKPATFAALLEAWQPDVAATVVYAVDRTCHRFWRDAFPDPGQDATAPLPREGSLLRSVLRELDAGLGTVAAGLGPDDVLIVASDHGFERGEPRHVWAGHAERHLAAAGLDPERDGFTIVGEFGAISTRVRPGPFAEREALLERLVAWLSSARGPDGEALLDVQVLDVAERPPGHERSLFARLDQWLFRQAAWWLFDTEFTGPAHAWIVARFDQERMQELWPDAEISFAGQPLRADALVFREDFDGTHHPTGVFVAAGGPIRVRESRGALSVLDVAPLIVHLAGAALPDDLEGELPRTWLDPAWLAAHPPRRVAAADAPHLPRPEGAPSGATGDPETIDLLRSLGYLE